MLELRSLKLKIILSFGACLVATAIILSVYTGIQFWNDATELGVQRARTVAADAASVVRNQLLEVVNTALNIGVVLESTQKGGMPNDRQRVNIMLKEVLDQHPDLLGVWCVWEPDAFDGRDKEFRNAPGHDSTGRFLPYWNRWGGIHLEPSVDYDKPGGNYYTLTKLYRKPLILDPETYLVRGHQLAMVSVCVPIIVYGEFLGVAGADLSVGFIQSMVDEANIMHDKGTLAIITNSGMLAGVTRQPDLFGQPANTLITDFYTTAFDRILRGDSWASPATDEDVYEVFLPIEFGALEAPWSVYVSLPSGIIHQQAKTRAWTLGGISALLLLLGLGVMWFVAARIARPITMAKDMALAIADGDYSRRIALDQHDEVGILVQAFNFMTTRLQETLQVLELRIGQLSRAESSLRESEQSLLTIFNSVHDAVILHNDKGFIVDANARMLQMFGVTREQALTLSISRDLSGPGAPVDTLRHHWEKALRGQTDLFEWETRRPGDDSYFLAEVYLCPITINERDLILASVRDITDRKRAEEELRQTQGYLDNIINSMPSVIIGVDVHGHVTHWNRAAEKLTGVEEKNAIKQHITSCWPGFAPFAASATRAIRQSAPVTEEKVTMAGPSGDDVYVDILIYPLVVSGVVGAVIRIDDVTQRARLEDMMIQTEKMMSVGGLAAGMAHEINNPLGAILQGVQNIQRRLSTELPASVKAAQDVGCEIDAIRAFMEQRKILRFLDGIRESGERAARIVRNMLNFSRMSESRRSMEDIGSLLDRSIELAENDYDLKKKYDFRNTAIIREYDDSLPGISCIASELEQVLLNLLKNAAQAMSEYTGGEGWKPRITIRTAREGSMARIEVQDNGPGMDEKTRKRVFEPFFTTKDVGIGTGLGLSVSYFIITNNHGGRFDVEAEPGKGTTFKLWLPIGQETNEPDEPDHTHP
ncbi:PAS domain S-box protein [Desulfobaculum sp. SPO524]|uniref:PAS domain S-box protein n=1 Tax=Desulfobaculum sp. SPO524 TaxID=3378071 RepID=UPI0038540BF6